jgi:uncharacterized protein
MSKLALQQKARPVDDRLRQPPFQNGGSVIGRGLGATLRGSIRAYQLLLSPLMAPACRFHPSCSNYAMQAIESHGPLRGTKLALGRLARCHPWNPGGVDEVPPPGTSKRHPL